jgi:hypothetical protein
MQKTVAVLIFFIAAVLAGWFAQTMSVAPAKASSDNESDGKERFMQKERGMPLDMQTVGGPAGYAGTSPILGSEPKPVSEKPYDMANDQELFQFEGNRISADCCPSPFSSDGGCVCLTDAQRAEFASRGGNRA